MTAAIVGIAAGLLTGVLSSTLVWWLLAHGFRPNVQISPQLARFTNRSGQTRCQPRVWNRGRRPIYDLHVVARMAVGGMFREGVTEWMTVFDRYIPVLNPGVSRRWSVNSTDIPDQGIIKLTRFLPDDQGIRLRDEENPLYLDELLHVHPDTRLSLSVSCVDSFSGARSVVVQSYRADDIVQGRFASGPDDMFTIEPEPTRLTAQDDDDSEAP
ncbi:MAG: hypothetical protein GY926_00620 [bacterium]|nr:hypothetical protein [bacterium]